MNHYAMDTETRKAWRSCEKYEATAFYCPHCAVIIEGNWAWDAKKALALHLTDRGVWESCPFRVTQPSGRVITRWAGRRWGILPVRRRERGCGRLLQHSDTSIGIHWYVFCEDCGKEQMRPGTIAFRCHTSMGEERGTSPSGLLYRESA